jgi:glycosyltransferase involved in cell wall biosynthesis
MHIFLINHLFPPLAQGGAESVVYRRAKTLVAEGHKVSVITVKPWHGRQSLKIEKTEEEGMTIYRFFPYTISSYQRLGNHGVLFRALWFIISFTGCGSARTVKKMLKQEKPDVVETHNLLGLGLGIPHVIQKLGLEHRAVLHDVQLVEPGGILSWNHIHDTLLHNIYSTLMQSRFGKPNVVETPSFFLQQFYKARGFFPKAQWQLVRPQAMATTPVKPASGKFLFVGSLVSHKGLRTLMEAWEWYGNTKASLQIVGKGPMQDELTEWAKKQGNVVVHGPLYGETLEHQYAEADTLIFPSICIENYPTVIIEARNAGLYIIASDTGGTKETFVKEKEGVLVEPGNFDVFSTAFKKRFE